MKTIDTLIEDIEEVVRTKGGWTPVISEFFQSRLLSIIETRFNEEERSNALRLSSIGDPCPRRLWYKYNQPEDEEELDVEMLGTFLYGDILEALLLSLAMAAGHRVVILQERIDVFGIPGHADCIIDGMLVDCKSASSFGFIKFIKHSLKEKDEYGYISQLSSYLVGHKDDNRVLNKTAGAFLVICKERFKLCLDIYDLTEEVKNKELEVKTAINTVEGSIPDKGFEDKEDGSSGNRILCTSCGYCGFKFKCWDNLREFEYAQTGSKYFTKVKKEPRVKEIKR